MKEYKMPKIKLCGNCGGAYTEEAGCPTCHSVICTGEGLDIEEYDFSKGERGKFYDKDAEFNLPQLDAEEE